MISVSGCEFFFWCSTHDSRERFDICFTLEFSTNFLAGTGKTLTLTTRIAHFLEEVSKFCMIFILFNTFSISEIEIIRLTFVLLAGCLAWGYENFIFRLFFIQFQNVLAITFTRKAAGLILLMLSYDFQLSEELRNRIEANVGWTHVR